MITENLNFMIEYVSGYEIRSIQVPAVLTLGLYCGCVSRDDDQHFAHTIRTVSFTYIVNHFAQGFILYPSLNYGKNYTQIK